MAAPVQGSGRDPQRLPSQVGAQRMCAAEPTQRQADKEEQERTGKNRETEERSLCCGINQLQYGLSFFMAVQSRPGRNAGRETRSGHCETHRGEGVGFAGEWGEKSAILD